VPEFETAFAVPPTAVETWCRFFEAPPPTLIVEGERLMLAQTRTRKQLYLFLETAEPRRADRLILQPGKGGRLRARLSSKQWLSNEAGPPKLELANPPRLEPADVLLMLDRRLVDAAFVKRKWIVRYGDPPDAKLRLDRIDPIDPTTIRRHRAPFWDIEFETVGGRPAAADLARAAYAEAGVIAPSETLQHRKLDRAALAPPRRLQLKSAADLVRFVETMLRAAT